VPDPSPLGSQERSPPPLPQPFGGSALSSALLFCMQLIVELRNHFVYHQPEWRDVDAEHHFERALKKAGVVENQQPISGPWFSKKALGAGLADWSCDVTTRFATSWWKRIGLKGKFDASFNQLPPP
jgi:hypothetical protein